MKNKWLPLVLLLSCSINATNIDPHNATVSAHETTNVTNHCDTMQYAYLPQEIKDAIFEAKNELPIWSNKYPEFYAAKEEHNAGVYGVIKNMLEELLTELPQEHTQRSAIQGYYQGIENQQFILEQAPTQITEITTQGMPTRYKRYKQFGSILVHLLEVTGEARFHGDTTFHDVGILGTVSIDKDVRMHGDQTIDGNLAVGENLAVEGDAGFAGNVAITNNLAVGGNQSIGGDLTIANNLIVNGTPITGTPSVVNVSTGQGELVANSTSNEVAIKTIKAGPNVTITNNAENVTITATLGGGAVSGPASSTNQALVRFDGASGAVIQNSGVILDQDE